MAIEWGMKDSWVKKRIGTSFANIFDDKNLMRALNRIGMENDWEPVIERFRDSVDSNLEYDNLSDSKKTVLEGALDGNSNDVIAEEAGLRSGTVATYKSDLVSEGYLEKEGWADYVPGEKILDAGEDSEPVKNDIEYDELSVDLPLAEEEVLKGALNGESSEEITEKVHVSSSTVEKYIEELVGTGYLVESETGYGPGEELREELEQRPEVKEDSSISEQADDKNEYGFSDVLNHLTGEDILDEGEERYLENELEAAVGELDNYDNLFKVLNSSRNIKVLGNIKDADSREDLRKETNIGLEEVDKALEDLEEADIVSTEEFKYGYGFEVGEEVESALQAVKIIHDYVKNQDPIEHSLNTAELEDAEYTEPDKDVEISDEEIGDSTGWAPFIVTFKAWEAYRNNFLDYEENGHIEDPDVEQSGFTGGRDPMAMLQGNGRVDPGEKYDFEELPLYEIGPELGDANYRDELILTTKELLNENGGDMEKTEFYEELGWDYDKADRVLREAAGKGIVRVFGRGNRGGIALTKKHYEPNKIREHSNL